MIELTLIALGASVGVAAIVGRWSCVAITIVVVAVITLYLVVNDWWYGNGWGEFGVAFNAMVGASAIAGAIVGVALRKALATQKGEDGSKSPGEATWDEP